MPAQIIDGKAIAAQVREDVRAEVEAFTRETGVTVGLADIVVGDDPASHVYVRMKKKAAKKAGIRFDGIEMPGDATQEQVAAEVDRLNNDPEIHGILIQSPVPEHLDEDALAHAVLPRKDVDGLTPTNAGLLALGKPCHKPCTPNGVIELLRRTGIETRGKKAVIVGRSNLVGRPIAQMLSQKADLGDATVVMCHSRTADLAAECRQADILIAAIGRARMITGEMIKPGAVVIDVGINQIDDPSKKSGKRLVGDVDYDSAAEVAGYITPVPGGVGPMTVAMLMANGLQAAKMAN